MKKENVRNIIIIAVALLIAMNYDKIMSMLRKGAATVDAAANNPNPKPPTVEEAMAQNMGAGTLAVDSRGDEVIMVR